MNTATAALPSAQAGSKPHLNYKPGAVIAIVFIGLLAIGLLLVSKAIGLTDMDGGVKLDIDCKANLLPAAIVLLGSLCWLFVDHF
jgi:hypothetical protein